MKNIVITGSTKGIGFAMANEFLRAGCRVTLSGRRAQLDRDLEEQLQEARDRYIYVPCDVRNKEDLQHLWNLSVEKWGEIDLWINNAGVNTPHAFAHETEMSDTRNVIDTNLTGMIYGCQVASNGMLSQGKGAIYSMEGLGSNRMIQPKTILYGTTKSALTYFMRGLAMELKGTGVIAGRLSPGMMLTDFITKTPDGQEATIRHDPRFRKIFNILADHPETVAQFFIPRMLANTKNDAHIVWLTQTKAAMRFIASPLRRRQLV